MIILIGIVICVVISMVTSFFFPEFNPGNGAVSTLYTVSGIMFSIGMSLIVTSSAAGVKNIRIRNGIRKEIYIVRNHFIECFVLVSFLYILLYSEVDKNHSLNIYNDFSLKYSHLLILIIAYSIVYFVWNFLAIQRLNYQIEDALDKDQK
jgi:magnesium-transporting ATPase (P-type)